MQTQHPTLRTALTVALALALSSCAIPVLPDDNDFSLYQKTYRNRAAGKFAELDRKHAAGTLSTDDYKTQRQLLESEVITNAHEALLRNNELVNQL